jgi:hypothetical protein
MGVGKARDADLSHTQCSNVGSSVLPFCHGGGHRAQLVANHLCTSSIADAAGQVAGARSCGRYAR